MSQYGPHPVVSPAVGPGPADRATGVEGDPKHAVLAALNQAALRQLERPLSPGLHVVATPIGHLGDISLRAIATLAAADVICCEDTRHSAKLLAHFAIRCTLLPYHEHNAAEMRPRILDDLARGARVALISDAGTPLVSDPGYKLVRAVIEAGHAVHAVPGASAVLASLAVAGLPTDSFVFAGFLSPKSARRRERLSEVLSLPHTVVLFEGPSRVAACLADIAAIAPGRSVVVARELTKLHETIARGSAEQLAARFAAEAELKGECVLLIGPATREVDVGDDAVLADLAVALEATPLSAAVKAVAQRRGVSRTRVYDLALTLQRRHSR